MRELHQDAVEISRLESGTSQVIAQPISVAEIFGDLERQFAARGALESLAVRERTVPGLATDLFGLGIVRRLSTLLGFKVTVQSTVGRGSTFGVEIPAAKVYPPRGVSPSGPLQ